MHADSRSRTWIRWGSAGWNWRSELQTLSLIEENPALDRDGDGFLSASELAQGRDWIVDYWSQHGVAPPSMPADGAQAVTIFEIEPELDGFGMVRYQWIALEGAGAGSGESVEVPSAAPTLWEVHAFPQSSPGHRDRLSVQWEGHSVQRVELQQGKPAVTVEPGASLAALRMQATAADTWGSGAGLLGLCAFWALARRGDGKRLGLSLLVFALAASVACVVPVFTAPGTLWRHWVVPTAMVYALADRWLQAKGTPWWPAPLLGVAVGGAWREAWQDVGQAASGEVPLGAHWNLPEQDPAWLETAAWSSPLHFLPWALLIWALAGWLLQGCVPVSNPRVRLGLGIAGVAVLFLCQRLGVPFFRI